MSLGEFVCLCVHLCVVILFSSEFLKHLEQDVSRILQGCFMGVSRAKGVLKVFQEHLKGVSGMFKR